MNVVIDIIYRLCFTFLKICTEKWLQGKILSEHRDHALLFRRSRLLILLGVELNLSIKVQEWLSASGKTVHNGSSVFTITCIKYLLRKRNRSMWRRWRALEPGLNTNAARQGLRPNVSHYEWLCVGNRPRYRFFLLESWHWFCSSYKTVSKTAVLGQASDSSGPWAALTDLSSGKKRTRFGSWNN